MGDRSHSLLLLVLSLPFMFPIPLPGLSVVFGLLVAFVASAWALGHPVRLPRKMAQVRLPKFFLERLPLYSDKLFYRVEVWIKPRSPWLFDHAIFRWLLAGIIILAGLFLALPLPPGTNFPPGIVIFVLSLSILERDARLAILGVGLAILAAYFMSELVLWMWNWVAQYLH